MDDYVIFDRNLEMDNGSHNELIFKKGVKYLVLSEDEEFVYVNSKVKTNECSAIPKAEEGFLFNFS